MHYCRCVCFLIALLGLDYNPNLLLFPKICWGYLILYYPKCHCKCFYLLDCIRFQKSPPRANKMLCGVVSILVPIPQCLALYCLVMSQPLLAPLNYIDHSATLASVTSANLHIPYMCMDGSPYHRPSSSWLGNQSSYTCI